MSTAKASVRPEKVGRPVSPAQLLTPANSSPLRVSIYLCLVAVLSFGAARQASGQLNFGSAVNYPAGAQPYALASADLNGDGKPDLAVGNLNSKDVSVLLGKGDGAFQSAVNYSLGVAPYQVVVRDLNDDGKLDLVTANPNALTISTMLGNGDGTFGSATSIAVGRFPSKVVTADFNRDGHTDLAVLSGNNDVSVLLGNGAGFQGAVSFSLGGGTSTLATGDFDGNGKLDIVSAGPSSVRVLLGKGDGAFLPVITSVSNATTTTSLSVGDFDRDGKLDVAMGDNALTIMKGKGDGSFQAPSFNFTLSNTSADMKAADFNGDGKIDLVSAGVFMQANVQILLGKGDGTFQDAGSFINSVGAVSLVVGDFNSDTRPDIGVCVNSQVNVVLINATPGNPDNSQYFVHQHYLDFLVREPDVFGFDYWTGEIGRCANDPTCLRERRIGVSAAFFVESEFQQSGYFVYRLYRAAFGRRLTYSEFARDRQRVVGGADLEANKAAFLNVFAQSNEFKQKYPDALSNTDFVNALFDAASLMPFAAERQAAITSLTQGATRASVLQTVIENATFKQREYNPAFVQMQYFGYLRRDEDMQGYDFWLDVVTNREPNNYRGMVCAFLTSEEYQKRFSASVTHTNAECGP